MYFWGNSSVGKKMAHLQKGSFVWRRKMQCEDAFQDLWKSCISFGGGLKVSNEEKMGRQQKEEVLWWNEGKHHLRKGGGGLVKTLWLSMNIWCMLDWILSQNCRNTLPLLIVDQLLRRAKYEMLLWLAGIKCEKIQTYCKAIHLIA